MDTLKSGKIVKSASLTHFSPLLKFSLKNVTFLPPGTSKTLLSSTRNIDFHCSTLLQKRRQHDSLKPWILILSGTKWVQSVSKLDTVKWMDNQAGKKSQKGTKMSSKIVPSEPIVATLGLQTPFGGPFWCHFWSLDPFRRNFWAPARSTWRAQTLKSSGTWSKRVITWKKVRPNKARWYD